MSDIYLDVNSFNDLFKILKNKNSFVDNTNSRLEISKKMSSQLEDHISYLSSSSLSSEQNITDAKNISKILEKIVTNLNTIKDALEKIEKKILELIMKKEDLSYSDTTLNEDLEKVKTEITEFEKLSIRLDSEILEEYELVRDYFNSTTSLNSDPIADTIFKKANTISDTPMPSENFNSEYNTNILDSMDTSDIQDNFVLRISEKDNRVYLPYSKEEILKYLKTYPDVFKDAKSVIKREFITELTFYSKHSFLARFREVYSLIRNREMKSFTDALKRAVDLMFRAELNPAIVAGLKSESQLDQLLTCLETNTLEDFKPFKIVFEINPAKRYH